MNALRVHWAMGSPNKDIGQEMGILDKERGRYANIWTHREETEKHLLHASQNNFIKGNIVSSPTRGGGGHNCAVPNIPQ